MSAMCVRLSVVVLLTASCALVVLGGSESNGGSGCVDFATSCVDWAAMGDCEKDPTFMHQHCRRSCNLCDKKACDDRYTRCAYWGKSGECQKNTWMLENCAISCGKCKGGLKAPQEL